MVTVPPKPTPAEIGAAAANHNHDGAYDTAGAAAAVASNLSSHASNTNNPHNVTLSQVGAAAANHNHDGAYDTAGAAAGVASNLASHTANTNNPHSVTLAQVGGAAANHNHDGAYDTAGAAAGVAGNLSTHAALTTAAHGGIVASNDSRLSDARAPTTHTHAPTAITGGITGQVVVVDADNYPAWRQLAAADIHGGTLKYAMVSNSIGGVWVALNPTYLSGGTSGQIIKADSNGIGAWSSALPAHASTHATGQADAISPTDIGAVATSDSRLSNSRTPTAHASSHNTGQSDALTPSLIGAAKAPLFILSGPIVLDSGALGSGSTAYATVLGSGIGSLTVPANYFSSPGQTLHILMRGYLTGTAGGGGFPVVSFKLLIGSTVVYAASFYASGGATTTAQIEIDYLVTCLTPGASGTFWIQGRVMPTGTTTYIALGPTSMTTFTINTTITQAIDFQVSSTRAGNPAGTATSSTSITNAIVKSY